MQDDFNIAARQKAEAFLQQLGVTFALQADGSLFARDTIDLSKKKLAALPDLSMVDAGRDFFCDDNQLTDLTGAPRSVQGGFYCNNNNLISLKGAPPACAEFDCSGNPLTSLAGGPRDAMKLYCDNTPLSSLEHAPEVFDEMQTPFGTFRTWDEVPQDIRLSPETKQLVIEAAVRSVTILDAPLTVGRALRFKR
jgi:hypothetical protein